MGNSNLKKGRLADKIVQHLSVSADCVFFMRNTLCDRHPCAHSPLSPPLLTMWGFVFVSCLLDCLALTGVHKTMRKSLYIESGGVRGRGQVVHYFVRQPLASEALLLQLPCLLRCFRQDSGTHLQTCYSVLYGRQEAAISFFQTQEQLFR